MNKPVFRSHPPFNRLSGSLGGLPVKAGSGESTTYRGFLTKPKRAYFRNCPSLPSLKVSSVVGYSWVFE